MEFVTDDTVSQIVKANGAETAVNTFKDNRFRLLVEPKSIETWELMVLENAVISQWLLIFARYLVRGETLVSPNLPTTPLDEISKADRAMITNSEAYKALKHFKIGALREAAKSFTEQATAGF